MESSIQNQDGNFSRKSPNPDHSKAVDVLLISRDLSLYIDQVLKQAGFVVDSVSPRQAKDVLNNGKLTYRVVIFCHTLYQQDISEIETLIRHRGLRSKLLVMLGPDSTPVDWTMFDHVHEGLAGPVELVQAVWQLKAAAASTPDKTQDGSSAMLA